ncbi:hypothetical protein A0U40_18460 [[Bacillus] sp. KCTC 13219]|nr:hypothetical protein A0U40_18460 [[Bacillus] sp. KCTC 13219]
MKTYNTDFVDYRFWLLPPSGKRKDVTDLLESATFTSTADGIVDTVNLRVKNEKIDGQWIHVDFYLGRRMLIEAMDEDTKWTEVYRGTFNVWQTNANDFTLNSGVVDANQLLIGNDIIYYFPDGSVEGRIKKICADIGMPVGRLEGLSASLSKELVKSQATTKILEYKEIAQEKTGVKTVLLNTKGKFEIVKRGSNAKIYVLDAWAAADGTDNRSIPSDFTTVVQIYGAEKKKQMPPLKATMKGDTSFGTHTQIIYSSDYKTAAEANAAAKNLLADKGKPLKKQTIKDHVDIPWIRVGDAVDVMIGTIGAMKNNRQVPVRKYVTAISRDYVTKTMTLELED